MSPAPAGGCYSLSNPTPHPDYWRDQAKGAEPEQRAEPEEKGECPEEYLEGNHIQCRCCMTACLRRSDRYTDHPDSANCCTRQRQRWALAACRSEWPQAF